MRYNTSNKVKDEFPEANLESGMRLRISTCIGKKRRDSVRLKRGDLECKEAHDVVERG